MIPDDELHQGDDTSVIGGVELPTHLTRGLPDSELQRLRKRIETHPDTLFLVQTVEMLLDEIDRLKAENEKLTAELAAKEIRWTDALPSSPGRYWHRWKNAAGNPPSIYHIYDSGPNTRLYAHIGDDNVCVSSLNDDNRQWSDKPISQPEERTGELPQEIK